MKILNILLFSSIKVLAVSCTKIIVRYFLLYTYVGLIEQEAEGGKMKSEERGGWKMSRRIRK